MANFIQKALILVGVTTAAALTPSSASAADWPAYRGPHGDGASLGPLTMSLPPGGPKELWKIATPNGFSSFAVSGGKAFTLVSKDVDGVPTALCLAVDANTGKELWSAPTGIAKFEGGGDSGAEGNKGGDGPRSTPTVDGNRVYIYSAEMRLQCLDAATGKPVWQHDIAREFNGRNIGWKSAASPLIDGELLFVAGGGAGESLLAFKKATGEVAWKTADEKMTHATPVAATILGARQILFLTQSGVVAVAPADGKVLWRYPFPYRTATGCSPVVSDNVVFCTAGYGIGAGACEVTKNGSEFTAKERWRVREGDSMGSLWSTPVAHKGYLYGMISAKKFGNGPLKCVDLKDGSIKWEQAGFGAGNLIVVGEKLLALSDAGEVVVMDADPTAYKERGRFKAISGKCWSTPALANGKLYVRSTKEGACFDLGKQTAKH